jgi:RNA polymerase sigma factor (sigma-70 family)
VDDAVTAAFEQHRAQLRAIAYRMLGSLAEADDAVQETWLRLARTDAGEVRSLPAWLTTVVARVCLDALRSRTARREDSLDVRLPDPIVTDAADPAQQAVLTDAVGLALMVVLDTLSPPERLAFVLHDVFAVPFAEIAPILDRSSAATKQLASRARQRLRAGGRPETDVARQRAVLDAFLAAARDGDFARLLAVLHPDVELRADAGLGPLGPSRRLRGASAVAGQALRFSGLADSARPVLVNGAAGLLAAPHGRPVALLTATIVGGRIRELDILADPDRLYRLLGGLAL